MKPWWDSAWLWSGIAIVIVSAIAAIVAVWIIAVFSRPNQRQ